MGTRSGTPRGLQTAGRRLWTDITTEYELQRHELVLLEQAARTSDTCAALVAAVESHGILTTAGGRIVPELVELRLQRVVLARLLIALRVPLAGSDAVPQYRGLRGMYGGVA